jgi:hypothetical protein
VKNVLWLFVAIPLLAGATEPSFTDTAPDKISSLSGKNLETKEFAGFGNKTSNLADKQFPLPSTSGWLDKSAPGFSKNLLMPEVRFNREYPTKAFRLDQRLSLRTDGATFNTAQRSPLDAQNANASWNKILPIREYAGREAALIQHEHEVILSGLSKIKDLPDHDLSIAEVKALLNKDSRPNASSSSSSNSR